MFFIVVGALQNCMVEEKLENRAEKINVKGAKAQIRIFCFVLHCHYNFLAVVDNYGIN